MRTHAFRLTRGQDLREGIEAYLHAHAIEAAAVVACVAASPARGCATPAANGFGRFARPWKSCRSPARSPYTAPICISPCPARTSGAVGGHLVCGCIVNTTAEVVLLELEDCVFLPRFDPQTGYHELHIAPKRQQEDP